MGEEEYLEGFPTVWKALKDLAIKAMWWAGRQIFNGMYWLGGMELKIFEAAIWA